MAKDYFQDIMPPQGSSPVKLAAKQVPVSGSEELETSSGSGTSQENTRSIRNIPVSSRAPRRPSLNDNDSVIAPSLKQPLMSARIWMWAVAVIAITILGILILVALRPTSVDVIPRSQVVVFDASSQFSAYPESSALTGVLPYTIETTELEDSAVVSAQGTEHIEEKASGTITVFNNYSAQSVKLIKNTRFETPEGLVFRMTTAVVIPGKKGVNPGEKTITVFADEAGDKYNIGSVQRFTLPGLKTSPAMYADVYARSPEPMTGGFLGEQPVISPSTIESARAEIRSRLEQKVRAAVQDQASEAFVVLPDLIRITYTSLPSTEEAGGGARIHESARVEIPVFPAELFAQTVSRGVSADAETDSVVVKDPTSLAATISNSSDDPAVFGSTPIIFNLRGTAQLVWQIDSTALSEALAGREESAFEAIVANFTGIEEARARVQPFWSNNFPEDPLEIDVRIEEPQDPADIGVDAE